MHSALYKGMVIAGWEVANVRYLRPIISSEKLNNWPAEGEKSTYQDSIKFQPFINFGNDHFSR